MTSELKCSAYEMVDMDEWSPCRCPVCGAYVKSFIKPEDLKRCKNCGTELLVIPDVDDGTPLEVGRICPISQKKGASSQ